MAARKPNTAIAVALVSLLLTVTAPAALGQVETLTFTTPFPSVTVEPDNQVSFDLSLRSPVEEVVTLESVGLPDGWSGTFRGGGKEISAATVGLDESPAITYGLTVPATAAEGTYTVTLRARGGGGSVDLPLSVTVSSAAGGEVTLTPNFPGLRTPAGEQITFNVTLSNTTPADLDFELHTNGPTGWSVVAELSGQSAASSVQVRAGGSQTINLRVTPPLSAPTGRQTVTLRAVSGEVEASTEVIVEVTGSYEMDLTTVDGRLNAEVTTGGATEFEILLVNTGTAELDDVRLRATAPRNWKVTFDNENPSVAPGQTVTVVATITPADNALAGDYLITFNATHDRVSDRMEVRTTVSPSALWGFIGIGLIALTLAGLAWVFRRFGRR